MSFLTGFKCGVSEVNQNLLLIHTFFQGWGRLIRHQSGFDRASFEAMELITFISKLHVLNLPV